MMGDFHYSHLGNAAKEVLEAQERAYAAMLQTFVEMEADFHISLGDLTHDGLPGELDYVFQRLKGTGRRFVHVLGNHDAHSMTKAEIMSLTAQQRYHAIHNEEATLIFLDTTKEMNPSDWGGELDAEQLAWLQTELVQAGTKPVMILAHHPVHGTTARSTLDRLSIDPKLDMKAVLHTAAGPGFYFCGHNHVNSIVKQENWHYIQTAACLDVPAFRIVDIRDGQVTIDLVSMDEAMLADDMALVKRSMSGFHPLEGARGSEADWSLVVDVKG